MINNKIITITKKNEFDRGWTLFRLFAPEQVIKRKDIGITVSSVIPKITRADKIGLILSEICLSTPIIKELEWVSRFIDIDLIARNEDIKKFYSARIKLKNVKIDSSITLNCLGIISKEPLYLLINNGYTEVGSEIYDTYFSGKKSSVSLELSDVHNVYICLDSEKSIDIKFLEQFKNSGANVYCAIPKECYCKSVYSMLKGKGIGLLVADVRRCGTLITNKSGELFQIHTLESGTEFKESVFSIFDYITGMYECLFLPEVIDYKNVDFPSDVYVADGKNIKRMLIKPNIKVNITVNAEDMLSFVNETFDSSVTEKHNDYSAETKEVEYVFELCPPCLPNEAKTSKIYTKLNERHSEWKALRSNLFNTSGKAMSSIVKSTRFSETCELFEKNITWIENIALNDFRNFYKKCDEIKAFLKDFRYNLLSYVAEAASSIGTSSESGKFEKIDAEIKGYRQTINEKQDLVNKSVNVLGNKQIIKRLQEKIEALEELKSKFKNDSEDRSKRAASGVLAKCEGYLGGEHKNENMDSLGSIVKVKEESKEMLLEAWAREYLYAVKVKLDSYVDVINKICEVDIPEGYIVYDAGDKRMIVINDIAEFESTKKIQEKYSLCCVVRR